MPVPITRASLARLNDRFRGAPPIDVLRFVKETFGARAALLSSMQRAGSALAHLANESELSFDVVFVDTGVLHRETLWTRDELARTHTRLKLVTLTPPRDMAAQIVDEGVLYLSKEGQERCCDLRKSAPLRAIKGTYDAFVSALRRGEGGARGAVETFALDAEMNALRVHPFAALTGEELDAYVASHVGVVVNPLHRMGFPTIGCFPCTTPVRPDEGERAGRWRHLADVAYCGINPVDRGASEDTVHLDDRYKEVFS